MPRRLVVLARHFRREVVGIDVPDDQYVHIAGSDLIRGDDGRWLVLEDNLRTPSGVSYVLANRQIMTRTLPDWFAELGVRSVDSYAGQLLDNLVGLSPRRAVPGAASGPGVVVLTAGHLQLRVLRARVPRAADGRRARRGSRPLRAREPRLHADDLRVDARWT